MELLKYIIIGFIQGITEPLPISSSAHMIFINHYLKLEPLSLSFEIIINFASTLAIIIFFFKDIKSLIINTLKRKKDERYNHTYFYKLLIASIPAGLVGIFFHDVIDEYFMNFTSASFCLLITGILLFLSILFLNKTSNFKEITYKNAFMIGSFQAVALIPGISRSGSTLTAGLSEDINIKTTLHFSFFMYLIASFGSIILSIFKLNDFNLNFSYTFFSFISAFFGTTISINFFYKKLNKKMLIFFMIYCFTLGIINLLIIGRS